MKSSVLQHRLAHVGIGILIFIGMLAMGGGLVLVIFPKGELMDFPLSLLDKTPFTDYFLPGLLLIILIGISSLICAALVKKDRHQYSKFMMYQALLIIGWLIVQLNLNKDFYHPLYHVPLFCMAIIVLIIGFYLNRTQIKRNKT